MYQPHQHNFYIFFFYLNEIADYQALVGYNDIKPNPLNTQKDYPTSCEEVFLAGNQLNGFYTIHQKDVLGGLNPFETVMTMLTVFCDFTKPDYYPGSQLLLID